MAEYLLGMLSGGLVAFVLMLPLALRRPVPEDVLTDQWQRASDPRPLGPAKWFEE